MLCVKLSKECEMKSKFLAWVSKRVIKKDKVGGCYQSMQGSVSFVKEQLYLIHLKKKKTHAKKMKQLQRVICIKHL